MQYASMSRELLRGENILHFFDNGEEYLDESLKSIINQSYQNWELFYKLILKDQVQLDEVKKIIFRR